MTEYIQLIRSNRNFALLWSAEVISLLGDWFDTIVLSVIVARFAGSAGIDEGMAVSLFLLARLVPPLFVSPMAGVLADRFNRKRLLIISDLTRACIVLLLVFAVSAPQWLWLIYLLTVFQFSMTAIFEPGRSAILPNLVRPADLVTANTLSSATWSAMLAIGAIAGGVVAAHAGTTLTLVTDACTFVISALLISQIRPGEVIKQTAAADEGQETPDTGFIDGLRYLRRNPIRIATLLIKTTQSLGNVDALMVIYATEIFIMGEDSTTPLSIMYAAFGLGAMLGPILLNFFNDGTLRRMHWLILVSYVWLALGWFFFSGATSLLLVSLALVVRAMGGSAGWTYSSVIIQKAVPDHYMGRMFSLDLAGFRLASAISIAITGVLIDAIGPENIRQVVIFFGLVSAVPLVLWGLSIPWQNRQPEPVLAGEQQTV